MTWISKSITTVGLVLLAHACYSAQEHSALQSFRTAAAAANNLDGAGSGSAAAAAPAATSLPLDISIEAVVSLLVAIAGLVLGAAPLRPIQWREWAGKIEREGEEGFLDGSGEVNRDFVGNPFAMLETRPGFVDMRKERREFAGWVKGSGGGQ